ncbi:MAG: carboxypeptidase regulatory-like domain-containing protein [Mucilaginibacter sp.]
MNKLSLLFFFLIPFFAVSQISISGKVINQSDTKPIASASVFLSNATIGSKTGDDGAFKLTNVKPGKYDLVVSVVGFDAYRESVSVAGNDVVMPTIALFPKTIGLNEVTVKAKRDDPDRERYYERFKREFLGWTPLAKDCRIINPGLLDFDFKADSNILRASSADFLEIENDALGYKIKYLLKDFTLRNSDEGFRTLSYTGSDLFEELSGVPSQQKEWKKQRAAAYEGSVMHFLRAAIANRMEEEGFRVMHLKLNTQRPADNIVNARIKLFQSLQNQRNYKDSLAHWVKLSKLPRYTNELAAAPLSRKDLIYGPNRQGMFALKSNYGVLYISYNKNHHFSKSNAIRFDGNSTLVAFNGADALFDNNGTVADPRSLTYDGAWGRTGVADLLPVDYEDGRQVNGSVANPQINKLIARLKAYADSQKMETAYLQLDKPYYAAGDTLYFKACVVQGAQHEPTSLSGILNVDLIGENKISSSLKLQLTDGLAWGDIALPDTLKSGSYRLRAYTNWMRNSGDDSFFEQTIPVGATTVKRIAESSEAGKAGPSGKATGNMPDVQFLPEGGSLVAGNYSRIAFKAIGPDGAGISIKGAITDDAGAEVCTFASAHLGMGAFNIVPQAGKTYKAHITYADGTANTIGLPQATPAGYTITVNNASADTIRLRITAGSGSPLDKVSLIAQSGGAVYYAAESQQAGSKFFSAVIPKSKFPTGIVQFTLFSPAGEPLNERLVFINNHDQLKLNMATEKKVYTSREKVKINLAVTDKDNSPVPGSFSVAVTDQTILQPDTVNENNILSTLLLTSGLKGTVEQPGYYFANASDTTQANLDLLMLTQGYRRFAWKQVLKDDIPPINYQPERTLQISGTVKRKGKPEANAKVTLFTTTGGAFLRDTLTDVNGKFAFRNLAFSDRTKFVVQSKIARGQDDLELELDTATAPGIRVDGRPVRGSKTEAHAAMSAYLLNQKQFYQEQKKYGINKTSIELNEVVVKEKKEPPVPHSENLNGPGGANQTVTAKELEKMPCVRIVDCLQGVLTGVSFRGGIPLNIRQNNAKMAIVLDGEFVDPEMLNILHSGDLEGIEVVVGVQYAAIYGSRMANGALIVTTKRGRKVNNYYRYAPGVVTYMPKGFYKAREFYSPQYDNPKTNQKIPDLRSTIFWKPDIITDADGKASFSFFNADGKGTYRVVVEGIDADGNFGRQVYRYKVE